MSRSWALLAISGALIISCAASAPPEVLDQTQRYTEVIELADPEVMGGISLEQALQQRRSARNYSAENLSIATIGQLFWAGQGVTDSARHRTAPSAGATYPLELYAVTGTKLMHYLPDQHKLEYRQDLVTLTALAEVAFGQEFVSSAPAVLVITGVEARTAHEYGALAEDFVNREAGHAAQNILLQATVLNLAIVPVGGFDPAAVARLLALHPGEEVLYLLPVGYPGEPVGS
ncbi:MAG: SagB/ThcOx family dehydrogenase [Acidimicrobiales bacterium]|nr:SagB/ThcOx family dehydrogenase [Acidimicrobiales bacterium]